MSKASPLSCPSQSLSLRGALEGRWHASFFLNENLCSNHHTISLLYLSLVAKKCSRVLVLFPPAAFIHALSIDSASNTWRASVWSSLPEPTDFLLIHPLAIGRAPLPLIFWRKTSSFPCPVPPVRACHAPRPDSICHVLAAHPAVSQI
jgi:hypothetical protein